MQSLGKHASEGERQRPLKVDFDLCHLEENLLGGWGEIVAKLGQARSRRQDMLAGHPPLRRSSCKLTREQNDQVHALFDSGRRTAVVARQRLGQANKPIEGPPNFLKTARRYGY